MHAHNVEEAKFYIPRGTFYMSDVIFKGPCQGKTVFFNSGTLMVPTNAKHITQDVWINFRYVDNPSSLVVEPSIAKEVTLGPSMPEKRIVDYPRSYFRFSY